MGRFLRSKKLRAALWIAAGGACQSCACDLGDGWHADHIVPTVDGFVQAARRHLTPEQVQELTALLR